MSCLWVLYENIFEWTVDTIEAQMSRGKNLNSAIDRYTKLKFTRNGKFSQRKPN